MAMAIAVDAAAHGARVIWGAPTYQQSRIGWEELKKAVAGVWLLNESRMETRNYNNGTIMFRSLDDADNVRGHTADGAVIDEAGFCKEEAWATVIRPMLSDTGGWSVIMGTPHGRNWFHREHANAADKEDNQAWQVPTLGVRIENGRLIRDPHPLENPHFPFDETKRLHEQMPESTFRQEFLAEFIDDAGGVFRGVRAAATAQRLNEGEFQKRYITGCDWAKHRDFTVFVAIDAVTGDMVAMDRFNQIDYSLQLERLRSFHRRFPGEIIAEANSMGEVLIEQLQGDGLPVTPFVTTNATKQALIESLAVAFERGSIRIIDDSTLIAELEAFTMERTKTGLTRYTAPSGMHDDCVIALALAHNSIGAGDWDSIQFDNEREGFNVPIGVY